MKEDKSQNTKKKKGRIILKNLTKEQREKIKIGGTGALLGAFGNAGIFSLMSFVNNSETQLDSPEAVVEDNLEESQEPIVVYTEAPFAESVNDDMSFSEAYASARTEVGPGGIFEWNGNSYNTYTKEEFDSMSGEEQGDYVDSIEGQISYADEDVAVEVEIEDSEIYEGQEFDIDGDGDIDAVIVNIDDDGTIDLAIDQDNDGEMDHIVLDIDENEGYTGNETIVEIDNDEEEFHESVEIDLDDPELYEDDVDGESIAYVNTDDIDTDDFSGLDDSYEIDNNVDMDDYV